MNVGATGIYAPPDGDFPDSGVVAIGEMNAPRRVFADLDQRKVEAVRAAGRVLNYRDQARQERIAGVRVERVALY